MEHLVFAANILSACFTMAGFGLFWFLYRTRKSPLLKSYLLYLSVVLFQLSVRIAGQYYFSRTSGAGIAEYSLFVRLLDPLTLAAFIYTVPRFFLGFAEIPFSGRVKRVFTGLSVLTVLLVPSIFFARISNLIGVLPSVVGLAAFLSAMFYSQIRIIRRHGILKDRLASVGIPVIIVYNLVCTVGGIFDSTFAQGQLAAGTYPYGTLFVPLSYLAWNTVTFAWAVKYEGSGLIGSPTGTAPDQGRVREFGITERELELVKLLYGGSANKEIADRLGLSGHTVRNHVHNVFVKTGARNRVELVRKLWTTG